MIYLYDLGSADKLRTEEAVEVILEDTENREKRLKAIEKESLIVAYELYQDDSRDLEVAVGEPLTSKEKKSAKWCKAQKTLLRLPSGKLRIESPNSLTIGDEEPDEEGATFDVPPGDYVLTLERVNWEEMDDADDSSTRPDLPFEFISLQPVSEVPKPPKGKAFLSWGAAVGDQAAWEGKYKIVDGVFQGLMKSDWAGNLILNFARGAAEKLGARVGCVLEIEGEGLSTSAVYLGNKTFYGVMRALGMQAVSGVQEAAPYRTEPTLEGGIALGGDAGALQKLPRFAAPVPVSIRVAAKPAFEATDNSFAKDLKVDKSGIEARVLSVGDRFMYINVLPEHLLKLGYKWGGGVEMRIGDDVRHIYMDNDDSKAAIAEAKEEAVRTPGRVGFNARVMDHWELPGLECWDLEPLVGEANYLKAKAGDKVEIRLL